MLIVKLAEEEVLADLAGICFDQPFHFGSDFLCCIRERIYLIKNKPHELLLLMASACRNQLK